MNTPNLQGQPQNRANTFSLHSCFPVWGSYLKNPWCAVDDISIHPEIPFTSILTSKKLIEIPSNIHDIKIFPWETSPTSPTDHLAADGSSHAAWSAAGGAALVSGAGVNFFGEIPPKSVPKNPTEIPVGWWRVRGLYIPSLGMMILSSGESKVWSQDWSMIKFGIKSGRSVEKWVSL